MPRANTAQTNFTAGEVSPRLLGRTDISKYNNGVRTLLNCFIQQQGGAYRRSGSRFVGGVKVSANYTRMQGFTFSTIQSYMLEFGGGYIRFYSNGGQIQVSGVPVEVSTPYLVSDLPQLDFCQSSDTLIITHPNYPTQALTRSSNVNWTLSPAPLIDGPYLSENSNQSLLVQSSGATGTVTLTASAALFAATDIGRVFRIRSGAYAGWCTITGFTDTTHVTAVCGSTNSTSLTVIPGVAQTGLPTQQVFTWRFGAFSSLLGYPSVCCFHQQRLWLAASPNQPQTMWSSNTGDYYNFAVSDLNGINYAGTTYDVAVLDTNSIVVTLASQEVNSIRWMQSSRILIIGTVRAEWVLQQANTSEGISPTNIDISQQTTYGSLNIPNTSILVDISGLFIHRSGRRVKEITFDFTINGYRTKDLTLLGEHILRQGGTAVDSAYQQEPDSVFYVCRQDGVLGAMTYVKEQDEVGWSRIIMGASMAGAAVVESISSIPSVSGTTDTLWMVVNRTIGGVTKRYIEYIDPPFDPQNSMDKTSMYFVDCGLTYNGGPATTFSGLDHLIGETVTICADGALEPDQVVSLAGTIILPSPKTVVHVGLAYTSIIHTLKPEAGAPGGGTAQAKISRVDKFALRCLYTMGMQFGSKETGPFDEIDFRKTVDAMDTSPPLFTGDVKEFLEQDYGFDDGIVLVQSKPYPMNIISVYPEAVVYE